MDSKSADDITTAIADIQTLKLRLTALENALRKNDHYLLEAWLKEISSLASETPYQMLPVALENLKKRLESE